MDRTWTSAVEAAAHLREEFGQHLPADLIDEVLRSVLLERRHPVTGPVAAGVVTAAENRLARLVRARRWRTPET